MKRPIPALVSRVPFLGFVLILAWAQARGQNGIIGTGFSTGWTNPTNITYFSSGSGTSRILIKTANGTGNQYFRFVRGWSGDNTEFGPAGCTDFGFGASGGEYSDAPTACGGAFYLNVASTTDNYVFKTRDGATDSDIQIFRIQGPVRSVANAGDVTRTSPAGTVYPGQAVTIQAVLNGTPSPGQGVYLRYTNNAFTTSNVVEMTLVSGSTYTGTIPASANSAGSTVEYYVLTSGAGKTIAGTNAAWFTINTQTNGGANYNYAVAASWLSAQNGNWNDPATWVTGQVPPSFQPVTIATGHTVTLNANVSVNGVTIQTGATLIGSDGTTRSISIYNGGGFTNNGTYTATATGAVGFVTGGSITGTSPTTFGDVSIQNGGVAFGNSTINNGLTIFGGGFVSSGTIAYGSTASLWYQTGGTFSSTNNEWPTASPPRYVRVSNTTLVMNQSKTIAGNLRVDANAQLHGPAAASTSTITFTGSPSLFQMEGIQNPNPGLNRNLSFVIGSGTTYLYGSAGTGVSNPNFRFYDITINAGATLQAHQTGGNNAAFELQFGQLTNNGTLNLAPAGGSIVNVTTRGTSGNSYSIAGTGTTIFNGLIIGQTSTLTLNQNIEVKSYLTVATPTASLVPAGNRTVLFSGANTFITQETAVDPNPSFGNTFSIRTSGFLTFQSGIDVFHATVDSGGTLQLYDGGDNSLRTRSGATVLVKNGGTLRTGTLTSGSGRVYSTNGGGTFTLEDGGHLVSRAPAGIWSAGATGPIQTATRNFSSDASYTFEGAANMVQGVFTTTPADSVVRNLFVNISGANSLQIDKGTRVSRRLDLLQGNIELNGKMLISDSIIEARSNQITGAGSILAKRFFRTSYGGGLSGTGAAVPTATITLTDTSTVEYYAATGAQQISPRADYGNLWMSGGTGANGQKLANGDVTVRRNWQRTGADYDPSVYKVTFSDSSQSTISAPGGETFAKLVVQKDTGRISLLDRVTVRDSLKVLKGKAFTLADTLVLEPTGHMVETVGATDHYVVGILQHTRTVGTAATSMGGTGVEMSAGADLGVVSLTRHSGPGAAVTGESPCCSGYQGINRRWVIEPQFQPSLANRYISFRWPSEDDNGKDLTQFQLWRSPDGIQPFTRFGAQQDVSALEPRVASAGPVVSFSVFTGSDEPSPLPVTWLSFNGVVKNAQAHLSWRTATEVNAAYFTVQRSQDGRSFTAVGTVRANGKGSEYAFADAGFTGAAYYRLLQTDLDGTFSYSKTLFLRSGDAPAPKPVLFPNPLAKGQALQYSSQENGLHRIVLYSAHGQELAASPAFAAADLSLWIGQRASALSSGPYVVRAITPSATHVIRWVKE